MIHLPLAGQIERVLCLGAHSDDIEIGCGATLLRLIEENPRLKVMWVVFGGDARRKKEARLSALSLLAGIPKSHRMVFTKGYRDAYFPGMADKIKTYFETLKRFDPQLIFTHFRDDAHQDHRTINQLTWNTFRNHLILEYEILKYDGDLGHPNVYVTIPEAIVRKKVDHLMRSFPSQTKRQWYTVDAFLGLMRIRGVQAGSPTRYAEGFFARKICL